ncbi:Uncharacterised protein [Mycobacteroides abscessus subsp. abscessus]|uniref:hypothetical protein n=1 Tax=Mycobacteroides abscessus TaxID=36809 RepID=UPI00092806BD|nr:hypothetical protein [Mycobacteroides abscessus]SIH25012.1 Uncharacterised protein [Mycobacteroides abscessus subsp. abscessus]
MVRRAVVPQLWIDAFRPACRARGLRYVGQEGFVVDDVYISSILPSVFHPDKDTTRLRISWEIRIKPLAVDEILWAAFMPDVAMGPQMRINRRINGAFQVQPLQLQHASTERSADDEPNWGPILDEFDAARTEFIHTHPTLNDYVHALQNPPDRIAANRNRTRMITALMAAGRNTDAAHMAQEAIDRGEQGSMSSTTDVLKYLAAYAKGPEAYSAFTATLLPTHDYQVLYNSQRADVSGNLTRHHHAGRMAHYLASMDGADPWAVVLSARPTPGALQDHSTLRYLQAAGRAEAMVIEYCQPDGHLGGCAVRSVVGHPGHAGSGVCDVEIVLPRSTEKISRHEVFTAHEAATLFETFYRTDTIGEEYVLRPVETYRQ